MIRLVRIWLRQIARDLNEGIKRRCRRVARKIVELIITDLDFMQSFRDVTSSAAFADEHLRDAKSFKTRDELFKWLLSEIRTDDGLFLEFGVYKGDSINRLASLKPDVTFYGFDSFVGLPEVWGFETRKGAFDVGGQLPPVRRNVELISGFFDATLPGFLAARRDSRISFMHVDCDLCSSTRTILHETRALLVPGSIIAFDELINYADWKNGEYKAFMEFVAETNVKFE